MCCTVMATTRYRLAPDFESFAMSHTVWQSRTEEKRNRVFSEFMAYSVKTNQMLAVTLTSGVLANSVKPTLSGPSISTEDRQFTHSVA